MIKNYKGILISKICINQPVENKSSESSFRMESNLSNERHPLRYRETWMKLKLEIRAYRLVTRLFVASIMSFHPETFHVLAREHDVSIENSD